MGMTWKLTNLIQFRDEVFGINTRDGISYLGSASSEYIK